MTRLDPPWAERLFVVAEAGVNHNGDLGLAFELIEAAADAGADAVKFQTWVPGEIVGRHTHKVAYLDRSTEASESFYDLAERLRLSFEDTARLRDRCAERGIMFLSTPEGFESLPFLVERLDMPVIKIGSAEVNHSALLAAAGRYGRPVILSTGASTLEEAAGALAAVRSEAPPDLPVAVLHCTSEYPAPDADMNLRALQTLAGELEVTVGLSDHSTGPEAAIAAAALGARVIEKHLTLDRTLPGPDHAASMEPTAMKDMIIALRRVDRMLGDGRKRPMPSEIDNIAGIRRSVVALRPLRAGAVLAATDLACKRPATGAPPDDLPRLVGRTLTRDVEADEPIAWTDVAAG